MPFGTLSNGESGASVRSKLNTALAYLTAKEADILTIPNKADQTALTAEANTRAAADLLRELLSNKAIDFSVVNDTLYPSVKAVSDKVAVEASARIAADALRELLSNKAVDFSVINDILYPTVKATNDRIQALIAALVNSSPATLDTLKELADALGDDPNFATTMSTALGLRELLSNKDTDGTLAANSDTKYPSQKAIKTYADALAALRLLKTSNLADLANNLTAITNLFTGAWIDVSSRINPTGFSSVTVAYAKYLELTNCYIFAGHVTGTSNAVTMTFAMPFNSATNGLYAQACQNNGGNVNGAATTTIGSPTLTFFISITGGAFTASGTKAWKSFIIIPKT